MLVDEVVVKIFSGRGGDGRVAFNKTKMSLGPTGGKGGDGGAVFLQGVADIGALMPFRGGKVFRAEDGQMGGAQNKDGRNGKDLVLRVPVGTVVHFVGLKKTAEITKIGEQILIAKGGKGGRGNFLFRSPTNTTPRQAEKGGDRIFAELRLELKLIADVGLIGLPNVGKSSLLNGLTNAKSRVANYAFTTLEPNLGAFYELILADIPGLIEGASTGKGLGHKFLRHIERTKILFHLVSVLADDPIKDYQIVRKELGRYNTRLLEKKEFIFLSQCDLANEKEKNAKLRKMKKSGLEVMPISLKTGEGIDQVKKILSGISQAKSA